MSDNIGQLKRKSEKPTFILRTDKMDKLIELLNEYDWTPTEWKQIWDKIYFDWLGWNSELHELIIISKYYGFIKWLVENNKIDIERLHKIVYYRLEIKENYVNANNYNSDCLLMLLSISSSPIEDLISYLK